MLGGLGHHGHTAERTDQGPKRYQDIPHWFCCLIPIAHEMSDGLGDEIPSWSWHEGVYKVIDIHMPTPGIAEGHRTMCVRHDAGQRMW